MERFWARILPWTNEVSTCRNALYIINILYCFLYPSFILLLYGFYIRHCCFCRQSSDASKAAFGRLKSGLSEGILSAEDVKKISANNLGTAMVEEAKGQVESSKSKWGGLFLWRYIFFFFLELFFFTFFLLVFLLL